MTVRPRKCESVRFCKNNEIRLSATSDGGSSLYEDELYNQATYAATVINESGIGNFDKSQLEKKYDQNYDET